MNIPSLGNCVCKSMFKGLNALKLNWISISHAWKGFKLSLILITSKIRLLILINKEKPRNKTKGNRIFVSSYNLPTSSKILKRCVSMLLVLSKTCIKCFLSLTKSVAIVKRDTTSNKTKILRESS